MRKYAIPAGGMLCLTAACSESGAEYVPIVDQPSVAFASDLESCQALARTAPLVDGQSKTNAAIGGVVGGLAAGLDDDLDGDSTENAIAGAVIGAATGLAGGAVENHEGRADIVKECLLGRGHRVVG